MSLCVFWLIRREVWKFESGNKLLIHNLTNFKLINQQAHQPTILNQLRHLKTINSRTYQLKNSSTQKLKTSPPHLPMPICQHCDGHPLLAQALFMK